MGNGIEMDDVGVTPFQETSILRHIETYCDKRGFEERVNSGLGLRKGVSSHPPSTPLSRKEMGPYPISFY